MLYTFGYHPVKDFDVWKVMFDTDHAHPNAAGIHCIKLLCSAEDPNLASFLFLGSNDAFDAFLHNPPIGELMQQPGVLAPPTFQFYTEG